MVQEKAAAWGDLNAGSPVRVVGSAAGSSRSTRWLRRIGTWCWRGIGLACLAALFALGIFVGRVYGTFDVYRQSRIGDYLDIPTDWQGGFIITGTVEVHYPDGAMIMVHRPAPSERENRVLMDDFAGGHLSLTCQAGTPDVDSLSITSEYNTMITDSVAFTSGHRQLFVAVKPTGEQIQIMGADLQAVLSFLADTRFPGQITIGAMQRHGQIKPLYAIPTFGVQNTSTRSSILSPTSNDTSEVPQPPSDPFRVMRRFCR